MTREQAMTRFLEVTSQWEDIRGTGYDFSEPGRVRVLVCMLDELRDCAHYLRDECIHEWVGGLGVIHPEDVEDVARARHVECRKCEVVYQTER